MDTTTHFARLAATVLLLFSTVGASGHELAENRAQLVLREKNLVSVTFFLNYTDVLHRTLAPERSVQDFVLTTSSLPPNAFKTELQKAQEGLKGQLTIQTTDSKTLHPERWVWPDPAKTLELVRQRSMQTLVAPHEHFQESQVEVRCELRTDKAISGLQIVFPSAFGRVLTVTYRPVQKWAEPGGKPVSVSFSGTAQ